MKSIEPMTRGNQHEWICRRPYFPSRHHWIVGRSVEDGPHAPLIELDPVHDRIEGQRAITSLQEKIEGRIGKSRCTFGPRRRETTWPNRANLKLGNRIIEENHALADVIPGRK